MNSMVCKLYINKSMGGKDRESVRGEGRLVMFTEIGLRAERRVERAA